MAEKRTPQGILVRKVRFEFPPDLDPHWHAAKPEWSHLVNSASLLLPYLEPYLIDNIREAMPRITDPALREEAAGYIGQESQHFQQHRRFNDVLISKGYGQLRAHEQQWTQDYEGFAKTRSLKFNLAYTVGLETFALAVSHAMIKHRDHFFRGADPEVPSLFLWHFVEELEHKNVAFDVYQHVYGDYWYRVYGMLFVLAHLVRRVRQGYIILFKADGVWGKWRTRWAIKRIAFRLFAYLIPHIVKYALPGHHPSQVPDPAWAKEWVDLYEQGKPGLLKLDTMKLHLPSVPLSAV